MSEIHSEVSSTHEDEQGKSSALRSTSKDEEKEAKIDSAIKQLKDALMNASEEKYSSGFDKSTLSTKPKVYFDDSKKKEESLSEHQRPPISSHDAWLAMRLRNLAYTRGGPGQIRYIPRLDSSGYPTSSAFLGTGIYSARPEDWFDRHIQKETFARHNEEMRHHRNYFDDLALSRGRNGEFRMAYDYRHEPWRYMEYLRKRDHVRRLIPDHISRELPLDHEFNFTSRYDYPFPSWTNYDSYLNAMSYMNGPIPNLPFTYNYPTTYPHLQSPFNYYKYPSYLPPQRHFSQSFL